MKYPPRKTVVCVTEQKTCERLIKEGARVAGEEGLWVIHIVRSGGAVLGAKSDNDALDYLFRISREYGAEMEMIRSDDVVGSIADYAKKNEAAYLVVGAAKEHSRMDVGPSIHARLPQVRVIVVPE